MTPILPDLWRHLARWRGYTYGPLDHGAKAVDCSSFAASVLREAYGPEAITRDVWMSMQVLDPVTGEVATRRPWIGIEAVAEAVGELPVHPHVGPYQPRPGLVHLCQGWRHLTTDGIGPGSRGHAWLWLSYGGWLGVCIESSVTGPRVWDGHGPRPVADVVDAGGRLVGGLRPLDWSARAQPWTDGVAWTVLP